MTFSFYTPEPDQSGRPILVCVCNSRYGNTTCEITYSALGQLSNTEPASFNDAKNCFEHFAGTIRSLWVAQISRLRHSLPVTVSLTEKEIAARSH